jgi:carbon-monoxide dehydrogenase medium subunit
VKRFEYYKPVTLEQLWELKSRIPDARIISGGTDILIQIKNKKIAPPALFSLRSIPELRGIHINEKARIGALTTLNEILFHPEIGRCYPILNNVAGKMASVQIRNTATIGGNICNASPCADMAVPILVLDAELRLKSNEGERDVTAEEFFLGPGETCLKPGEILTDILLPPFDEKSKTLFLKKGRVRLDLAVASVGVSLEMKGRKCRKARLAAGSVAPVPLRLKKVEKILEGEELSVKLINEARKLAEESVSPINDVRSTAEYRREIVGVFVKRMLEEIRRQENRT